MHSTFSNKKSLQSYVAVVFHQLINIYHGYPVSLQYRKHGFINIIIYMIYWLIPDMLR